MSEDSPISQLDRLMARRTPTSVSPTSDEWIIRLRPGGMERIPPGPFSMVEDSLEDQLERIGKNLLDRVEKETDPKIIKELLIGASVALDKMELLRSRK